MEDLEKYLDSESENYVPFEQLLKERNTTLKEITIFILFRIAHGMKYKGKIDELFRLMRLSKEQKVLIENLAQTVSMQDINEYKCSIVNKYPEFNCYLYSLEDDIEIAFIRRDCRNYISHEFRQITTYRGKVFSNNFDTLDLRYIEQVDGEYIYSWPKRTELKNTGWGESTTIRTGERNISLFSIPEGLECVYFRKNICDGSSYDNVLIGVASDHPYLAHALAIQRFREAGGYVENEE